MLKQLDKFLDREFTLIQAGYFLFSILGICWIISLFLGNIFLDIIGTIFIILGIYGIIRQYARRKK